MCFHKVVTSGNYCQQTRFKDYKKWKYFRTILGLAFLSDLQHNDLLFFAFFQKRTSDFSVFLQLQVNFLLVLLELISLLFQLLKEKGSQNHIYLKIEIELRNIEKFDLTNNALKMWEKSWLAALLKTTVAISSNSEKPVLTRTALSCSVTRDFCGADLGLSFLPNRFPIFKYFWWIDKLSKEIRINLGQICQCPPQLTRLANWLEIQFIRM